MVFNTEDPLRNTTKTKTSTSGINLPAKFKLEFRVKYPNIHFGCIRHQAISNNNHT